jgi:hypothetical protein
MTTNWSESLNSIIRGTRSLPIIAFVTATFYRVNQAFVDRCEVGRKLTTQLQILLYIIIINNNS